MIWNYNGLLIICSFARRSFNLVVCFLNQILFSQEFLREAFWGLSFFSSSLMMCHSKLSGMGYETRQTPLLYVFVGLKVHNVQKHSFHFDCIDQ